MPHDTQEKVDLSNAHWDGDNAVRVFQTPLGCVQARLPSLLRGIQRSWERLIAKLPSQPGLGLGLGWTSYTIESQRQLVGDNVWISLSLPRSSVHVDSASPPGEEPEVVFCPLFWHPHVCVWAS